MQDFRKYIRERLRTNEYNKKEPKYCSKCGEEHEGGCLMCKMKGGKKCPIKVPKKTNNLIKKTVRNMTNKQKKKLKTLGPSTINIYCCSHDDKNKEIPKPAMKEINKMVQEVKSLPKAQQKKVEKEVTKTIAQTQAQEENRKKHIGTVKDKFGQQFLDKLKNQLEARM